jgi:hypothetical protein
MRVRTRDLLALLLILAVVGCIKIDEWNKYNQDPGQPCTSNDECTSCPEGYDWECAGPPGDEGLCTTREGEADGGTITRGICRLSMGETGMNCAGDPTICDYGYSVYANNNPSRGVCSKVCDDGVCPARSICIQTPKTGGGTINWCAQTCATTFDCDTNSTCQSATGYGMVCFPT